MEYRPVMSNRDLEDYLYEVFPELLMDDRRPYRVQAVEPGRAEVLFAAGPEHLRPGGTISGPAMMALADLALYAVILAHIGREPLAVTTSLNFNFIRKPEIGDLVAHANLLKLGKGLAVGEISIKSHATGEVVSHATGTYSIPNRGR